MIEAKNVSVFYKKGLFKKIHALDNFSLNIERGSIFGLLGSNGAGKSTAMYCFLGLIQPDKGSINVMGEPIYPGSPLFKKIGYLPEEPFYHLYLTVEEAVRYYAELYGLEIPKKKQDEMIEKFGLWNFRKLKLSHCSKGMKQKVGIIQTLINEEAQFLFMDEPTRGLDPIATKLLRDCLLERKRKGTTIVLNSHILSEVEMICDRIAILDKGKIILEGDLKQLLAAEKENFVVEFQPVENLPEYILVEEKTKNSIKGLVSIENITEFISFISQNKLRLYECSLKKKSLEEEYFNIFKTGDLNEKTDYH